MRGNRRCRIPSPSASRLRDRTGHDRAGEFRKLAELAGGLLGLGRDSGLQRRENAGRSNRSGSRLRAALRDHRGRRRKHGSDRSHARRAAGRRRSACGAPAVEPRQGGGAEARFSARPRQRGAGAGRRPGIRSGRIRPADSADRQQRGRRGVWQPLSARAERQPGPVSFHRQSRPHALVERGDQPAAVGHGNGLQGVSRRPDSPGCPSLRECGFGIEPEITAKIARIRGVRICERPIHYAARGYAQGKKIGWRDGVWTIWCILRYGLA